MPNGMNYALQFVGGLGMFIYGMHVMAIGLQKSAGVKMKSLLETVTRSKVLGVLVGAGITAIIQSSSATTVMVVGFVNAGLMSLSQSVGLIMGANIGTTITSWLVSSVEWSKFLNPTTFAPIAVGVGAAMALFSGKDKLRQIGELAVGFGILFIGMNTMTEAAHPLRDSEVFKNAFVTMSTNPFLGVLAGVLVTSVIQSSSASVGILQSLAATGIVPFGPAVYIIMGQNIGTCITAILSSIGANKNAKAAAYVHLLFNILGTLVFTVLAMIYFGVINKNLALEKISLTQISLVHTSFNIGCTLLLYPLSDALVKLAKKIGSVSDDEKDSTALVHLDDRMLETPSFAMEGCVKEIIRYAEMAMENVKLACAAILETDDVKVGMIDERENNIDTLAQAITGYLVKLSNSQITHDQNAVITSYFHTVSDIERIGDYCENLGELVLFMKAESLNFSEQAGNELKEVVDLAAGSYENSIESLKTGNKKFAEETMRMEQRIDILEKELREKHIQRLRDYECSPEAGVAFLEAITCLERISDHAQNIAEVILEKR